MKYLGLPLLLMLGACAAPQPAPSPYEVSGQLYHADGKVRVFVNGEPAADGWVPMTESFGLLDDGERDHFPLVGSYRGQPVEVNCGNMPSIPQPYCLVEIGGQQAAVLRFDAQGNSYSESAG